MKRSRILSVSALSCSVHPKTAKMVVCVFWLLGNLQILRNDLDVILFSREKYQLNIYWWKKFMFVYSCAYTIASPSENHGYARVVPSEVYMY